jgi:hypothetical protein
LFTFSFYFLKIALSGSFDCAKYLLEHGARVSGKTMDGKNALHLASSYGHHRIVKLLLKRGEQLKEENEKKGKEDKEEDKEKDEKPTKKGKAPAKKVQKKKKNDSMDDEDEEGSGDEDDDEGDDEVDDEGDDEGEGDEDFEGKLKKIKIFFF